MPGFGERPRILGVQVREYKNLRDVWLPWSDGVALVGANGAGKTNLLECLALLLGTAETLALARPRLQRPGPGALSIVVLTGVDGLPGPPDQTLPYADAVSPERVDAENAKDVDWLRSLLGRAAGDGRWWRDLGVRGGVTFRDGIDGADLPSPVAVFLAGLAVVAFHLESIDLDVAPAARVTRRFRRTLVVREDDLLPAVRAVAPGLPPAFAPLRRALDEPPGDVGGWVPVLELPPVDAAPAVLQWLVRSRTDDEIAAAVAEAFQRAAAPAADLQDVIRRLPFRKPPEGKDWHWWLHELASGHGTVELRATARRWRSRPAARMMATVRSKSMAIPRSAGPGLASWWTASLRGSGGGPTRPWRA